ncbi:MFS transporter protein [Rutstroemia sp. NJR-2017a BBW]|nr:MFS transporter protein [Rutstroemia sp. NJR-2017a BBW]
MPLVLKLTSAILAFFTAGLNDGSLGSLIPYILTTYTVSTSSIAFLYLSSFMGWMFAAVSMPVFQAYLHIGNGGLLLLGASLQLAAQLLRIWGPPWALFVVSFGIAALGQAYQDAQANTYVAQLGEKAHRWLGVIHAAYSVGCLVGPLAVTGIASANSEHWTWSYGALAGVAGVNVGLVIWAFGGDMMIKTEHADSRGSSVETRRNTKMWKEIGEIVREKNVWFISLFFFFHLGSGTTIGGWLVTYLLTLSPNSGINASSIGYLPTLFYTGIALGRLILIEPTHRYGERPMLLFYSALCIILQINNWRIFNLVGSVVIICLMGFLLGPFFPAAISHTKALVPSRIITPALSLIFVIAQAGGTIFPALTGIVAARLGDGGGGVKVLQPVVLGLLGAMMAAWWLVPGVARRMD